MSLNIGHALTGYSFCYRRVSDLMYDPDRGFQENHVKPLNTIKMHPMFADAIYLLALLTNLIVEASMVDPDQQQSILCLHCLTFKTFQQTIKS